MTQLNFQLPILTNPNSSEDPKVHDALQQIQTVVNGELDDGNLNPGAITSLLRLAVAGTGRKVAFGSQTLTWAGGNTSDAPTVTHGLGVTPTAIVANVVCIGSGQMAFAVTGTPSTTTFPLQGYSIAVFTGTLSANWVAIG